MTKPTAERRSLTPSAFLALPLITGLKIIMPQHDAVLLQ
jgi:hypothetical protein